MPPKSKHFRKRDAILHSIRDAKIHPSADWVFARLKPEIPDLSLGTVYRNLALFKEQGLIASVGTVQGAERFDGDTSPHVHFICNGCGTVCDLAGIALPDSLSRDAAALSGAEVAGCQLTFTGLCRNCKNQKLEEAI